MTTSRDWSFFDVIARLYLKNEFKDISEVVISMESKSYQEGRRDLKLESSGLIKDFFRAETVSNIENIKTLPFS